MTATLQLLSPFAWPLSALAFAVVLLAWLCSDIRPIASGLISGLAEHAKKYAPSYGIAVLLGLAASLQSLAEVAEKLGWVYAGAFAKVAQPGIVAVIGFIMRSPHERKEDGKPAQPLAP